jgi:predicted acyltransferase
MGIHDTVGFFNNIPAVSTALAGILTGTFLRKSFLKPQTKALRLLMAGLIFIILAHVWNLDFPINKNMWSSSFVLYTTGLSLSLLSAFYYIIDVLGYKRWAFFFEIIGMNSILIYMSDRFIHWHYTTDACFRWLIQLTGSPFDLVIMATCIILIKWLLLYLLYEKKIFLRV